MKFRRFFPAALGCAALLALCAKAPAAPGTLEQVRARGFLICGVGGPAPGFAAQDEKGAWSGFDVDFCRALAAAIFDDPAKVRVTPLAGKERLKAVQSGFVDVLARGAWTLSRDVAHGALHAAISFYDGQGFLARKKQALASARDLSGAAVCVHGGSPAELGLTDYFRARNVAIEPKLFPSLEEAAKAYDAGECDALTTEVSLLAAARLALASPKDHEILADLVDKQPSGPVVRTGDDQWFNLVRWTHFAMVDAEELGSSAQNVDEALKSQEAGARRLLGVEGGLGEGLGLDADWAYRIVKHVGDYGEVFERNLGRASPLGMERRLNELWSRGGVMYAPPAR